jgi:hypothetical protein
VQPQLALEAVPVRHGKPPQQTKPPLLLYEGRDLHNVTTLRDFVDEYVIIYLKLFAKGTNLIRETASGTSRGFRRYLRSIGGLASKCHVTTDCDSPHTSDEGTIRKPRTKCN